MNLINSVALQGTISGNEVTGFYLTNADCRIHLHVPVSLIKYVNKYYGQEVIVTGKITTVNREYAAINVEHINFDIN